MDLDRNRILVALGCATDEQLSEIGDAGILEAKSAGSVQLRAVAGEIKANADGTFRFKISDETPDRMGDIVRQKGMDARNFLENPVVLLGHDQSGLSIGVAESLETIGKATYANVRFSEANPMGRIARAMVEEGTMRATSIGFIPKTVKTVESSDERAKLGLGRWGVIFEEWELLEFSLVTVPANPNAVAASLDKAVERGLCGKADAETFKAKALPTERDLLKRLGAKAAGNTERNESMKSEAPDVDSELIVAVRDLKSAVDALPARLADAITKALPQGGIPGGSIEPKAAEPDAERKHYSLSELLLTEIAARNKSAKG